MCCSRPSVKMPRVMALGLVVMITLTGTSWAGSTGSKSADSSGVEIMSIEGSYNFRRVSDRITTSGVVGDKRLAGLQAQGYGTLINLLPDQSEHAVPEESAIVTSQGLHYIYIPVDFAAPTRADLDAFSLAMDAADDKAVHVHCAANFRVSAFYSLYAMRKGLWTQAQADEFIAGLWNPDEYPAWSAFIAQQRRR